MEFENVEEALEFLLDVNHQGNNMKVATVNPDGTRSGFKKATLEDYKESNREAVYALCDMLGLEKVYFEIEQKTTDFSRWMNALFYFL